MWDRQLRSGLSGVGGLQETQARSYPPSLRLPCLSPPDKLILLPTARCPRWLVVVLACSCSLPRPLLLLMPLLVLLVRCRCCVLLLVCAVC